MKERLCLAVVGVGEAAQAYLEAMAEMPQLEVGFAVDPDPRRLEGLARDVVRCRGVEELLQHHPPPDLAVICTPPAAHYDPARTLLARGVHLLVEKPLTLLADQAADLVALAQSQGVRLITAAKFRVYETILQARREIDSGRIGELRSVENIFSSALDARASWRSRREVAGGGIWADNGPHSLDVLETLAGPVADAWITQAWWKQGLEVEDEVVVAVRHRAPVSSEIRLSWNGQQAAPIARCIGTEGEIVVGWAGSVLRLNGEERALGGGYVKKRAFRGVMDAFLSACAQPVSEPDHGARIVGLVAAAYARLDSRGGPRPAGDAEPPRRAEPAAEVRP